MQKPDSELTEVNRITLLGQRLNNLNKWLTRAMSSLVGGRVVCLGLGTRMNINNLDVQINRAQAPMRLLNEGDVRLMALSGHSGASDQCPLLDQSGHWWVLTCGGLSAYDPKRTSRGLWSQQPGSGKERPIRERWLKDWERWT